MTVREAEVTHCMGVRGIGIRLGSVPLDMSELTEALRDTHTITNSEEITFCEYTHLLTFKDNNSPTYRYFFTKE